MQVPMMKTKNRIKIIKIKTQALSSARRPNNDILSNFHNSKRLTNYRRKIKIGNHSIAKTDFINNVL